MTKIKTYIIQFMECFYNKKKNKLQIVKTFFTKLKISPQKTLIFINKTTFLALFYFLKSNRIIKILTFMVIGILTFTVIGIGVFFGYFMVYKGASYSATFIIFFFSVLIYSLIIKKIIYLGITDFFYFLEMLPSMLYSLTSSILYFFKIIPNILNVLISQVWGGLKKIPNIFYFEIENVSEIENVWQFLEMVLFIICLGIYKIFYFLEQVPDIFYLGITKCLNFLEQVPNVIYLEIYNIWNLLIDYHILRMIVPFIIISIITLMFKSIKKIND